jgi:hypothetical protein
MCGAAQAGRFFMNGDEWGLYEVLPAENAAHCRQIAEQYRAHHKDTDFAPMGWSTPPYVIPPPAVPLSARRIRLADLDATLGTVMQRAVGVDSCEDFTGPPYPCPDCFAYAFSLDDYWLCEGFYGRQDAELVQSLHATDLTAPDPQLAAAAVDSIVQLGRRFDLFLRAGADRLIDLRDPDAVAAFIDVSSDG